MLEGLEVELCKYGIRDPKNHTKYVFVVSIIPCGPPGYPQRSSRFVSLVNLPEKSTLKSSGSHVFRAHGHRTQGSRV